MNMQNIAVIGGGTMGSGIITVFLVKGFNVCLLEVESDKIEKCKKVVESNLNRLANKGIFEFNSISSLLKRLKTETIIENLSSDTDLIIEAIYENKDTKIKIFNTLNHLIKSDCIFTSNTSSISITELAQNCRPDKFIGMHFMNPVPVMKLVEIIKGYSTSNETFQIIHDLVLKIDKVPVDVNDYPGFISNRILMPMINEAIYTLMEGVASVESIDTVMKLGMNHPMGPLTLADFIGLDVCLSIMEVLYNGFNDPKYRPCPLLKKMVAAGKLGKKSGEGFYKY